MVKVSTPDGNNSLSVSVNDSKVAVSLSSQNKSTTYSMTNSEAQYYSNLSKQSADSANESANSAKNYSEIAQTCSKSLQTNWDEDDTTSQAYIQNKPNTVYTAGDGISVENNVISNTRISATWGNIAGTITSQTDLETLLDQKSDIDFSNISNTAKSVINTVAADRDLSNLSDIGKYKFSINKFNILGTITSDITLTENELTTGYFSGSNKITLPSITDKSKQITCILDFTTASSSYPTITNSNLRWSKNNNGTAPNSYSVISGVHNILIFKSIWENDTLYWESEYSVFGMGEITFSRPILSADGVLGGTSFAVSDSGNYSGSAYYAFDGNTSNYNQLTAVSGYWIFYNPSALKVSSITGVNDSVVWSNSISAYTVYGSNDNLNWTTLAFGTNSQHTIGASWTIPVNSSEFYKYHKIYGSSANGSYKVTVSEFIINAVYIGT